MMGSVGGPGGRFLGRLPDSNSRMMIAAATTTGKMLRRNKAMFKSKTKSREKRNKNSAT
jgi:hypothetical protein